MAGTAREWQRSEVSYGRFSLSTEKYRVEVFADCSGQITDSSGTTLQFPDLRDFIGAAKLLEEALVEHYGGYEYPSYTKKD
jgi:hypothetical protein